MRSDEIYIQYRFVYFCSGPIISCHFIPVTRLSILFMTPSDTWTSGRVIAMMQWLGHGGYRDKVSACILAALVVGPSGRCGVTLFPLYSAALCLSFELIRKHHLSIIQYIRQHQPSRPAIPFATHADVIRKYTYPWCPINIDINQAGSRNVTTRVFSDYWLECKTTLSISITLIILRDNPHFYGWDD